MHSGATSEETVSAPLGGRVDVRDRPVASGDGSGNDAIRVASGTTDALAGAAATRWVGAEIRIGGRREGRPPKSGRRVGLCACVTAASTTARQSGASDSEVRRSSMMQITRIRRRAAMVTSRLSVISEGSTVREGKMQPRPATRASPWDWQRWLGSDFFARLPRRVKE